MKHKLKTYNNLFRSSAKIFCSKILGIHSPVTASWTITTRCNMKCAHCGVYLNNCTELSTGDSLRFIDFLHKHKVPWLFISGGEPLLREDLGIIIKAANHRGIQVGLSSNGLLVPEKIDAINHINTLILSLDGPPDVHDSIRCKGSYSAVMHSTALARRFKVNTHFTCVLMKNNIERKHIDFMLDTCENMKIPLTIQPARIHRLDTDIDNMLAPDIFKYRNIIDYLVMRKKEGYKWLFNSISGLLHLRHWPEPVAIIPCVAGITHISVSPEGFMRACTNYPCVRKHENTIISCNDFEAEFNRIKAVECKECWCGEFVEYNKAYNLQTGSIKAIIGNLMR